MIQLAVQRDRAKPKSKKKKTTTTEKMSTIAAEKLSTTTTTDQPLSTVTTTLSTTATITTKTTDPTSSSTKMPNSIQDQITAIEATRTPKQVTPSIEDVLKQYNLNGLDIATTSKSTKYGTSNDAILASILKEQGIAPPTPKSLEVII